MLVVIDTNVLVSAMLSNRSAPRQIIEMVIKGEITPCYDSRIMEEYKDVLYRPRLHISAEKAGTILDLFEAIGMYADPPATHLLFTDEDDKAFYETALECGATLVTGNAKHFPAEPWILSPAEFLRTIAE